MRDFLGTYTFYHDQIPLSIYYLMYVPYSALILLACTWICPDKGFLQEPKVYYTPEESIPPPLYKTPC
jgi:hypothetical protein